MAGAICRRAAAAALAIDEIELVAQELVDEIRGGAGVIGVVAIDQDVDVGFDVGEHAAHHVALALQRLVTDDRPGVAGNHHAAVGGIVVVDEGAPPRTGSPGCSATSGIKWSSIETPLREAR